MVNTFDSEKLANFIEEFVSQVPNILKENPLTADLSGRIDKLSEDIDTPFTLAVVGQMRVGKSSLMNGIIGKRLAYVGVNETTATINFFKYGEGELKNKFRVHWKHKHFEDFPCDDIGEWIGESTNATQARYLDFFDDADFLKEMILVDTPGTRSVISDHSKVINNFLAEKRERQTLQHGGKADAILYVSGAVANVSDEEILKDFQENTRLPGSSPYNSVAVLHKWETLDVERPFEEAVNKAALMEKQFQKFVAKIIPVSGPLAIAAKRLDAAFWNELVHFLKQTEQTKLLKLLDRGNKRFEKHSELARKLFQRSSLPWPCFRFVLRHSIQEQIKDGRELRNEILRLSGIQTLMTFIKERFVERSTLVKSLTVLTKAIEPCKIAQLRLRNDIANKEKILAEAKKNANLLDSYITREHKFLQPVSDFLRLAQKPFINELKRNRITQKELGHKTTVIEECYRQIIGDLATLELLESNLDAFKQRDQKEIQSICGGKGLSVAERLSCYEAEPENLSYIIEDQIDYWNEKREFLPTHLKSIALHLVSRLEELLEELEKKKIDNEHNSYRFWNH